MCLMKNILKKIDNRQFYSYLCRTYRNLYGQNKGMTGFDSV